MKWLLAIVNVNDLQSLVQFNSLVTYNSLASSYDYKKKRITIMQKCS